MRKSRLFPQRPLYSLALAAVAALLLAGCGWSPGGEAMETPTAIAPLVLQPPATRSAELLTLVAMMPATATDTPAAPPSETSTPQPSETPTPVVEATTPPPEEPTATPTDVPTEAPTNDAIVEPTETVTALEDATVTAIVTVAQEEETPVEAIAEATVEVTPEATEEETVEISATVTATLAAEVAAEVATDPTAESTVTDIPDAAPEVSAAADATGQEVDAIQNALDVVTAVRATTITLPLAGAVTAFSMVDGWHAPTEGDTEATDARVRLLSPVIEGDLNGDGVDEVVALAEIGVGDRSLVYLLAFTNSGESGAPALEQVARVLVGADVRVGAPVIHDQIVRLEVNQWQGDSPLCCAVRRQRFGYALDDDMLALVESDDFALENGEGTINEMALMPPAVATAQARESNLQRSASVADEAEVDSINLYTVTVAAGETLGISAVTEALPVRLVVTSADEPVIWRDGSAVFPLDITLPAMQTMWIGVQGVEMATPYTLTVTLAPPPASR